MSYTDHHLIHYIRFLATHQVWDIKYVSLHYQDRIRNKHRLWGSISHVLFRNLKTIIILQSILHELNYYTFLGISFHFQLLTFTQFYNQYLVCISIFG